MRKNTSFDDQTKKYQSEHQESMFSEFLADGQGSSNDQFEKQTEAEEKPIALSTILAIAFAIAVFLWGGVKIISSAEDEDQTESVQSAEEKEEEKNNGSDLMITDNANVPKGLQITTICEGNAASRYDLFQMMLICDNADDGRTYAVVYQRPQPRRLQLLNEV